DLFEALAIEEDGTVFAAGFAVPADTNTAVARQRLLEKRHLNWSGFLHAQNVRFRKVECDPQRLLTRGPVELFPRRAVILATVDIPGDDADERRVSLVWRIRSAGAHRRPDDQPEPAREDHDEQQSRSDMDTTEPASATGQRSGGGLALV